MMTYQRRKALLDHLAREGTLTVRQAANVLQVSEVTIRADFNALARQGAIKRVRGGAILAAVDVARGVLPTPRGTSQYGGKLAARAAAMVEDGESIAISAGPLGIAMAQMLRARRHLKVVTNSLEAARLLAEEPTNTVVIAGGVVRPSGRVAIDADGRPALAALKVARAFLCGGHLSGSLGLLEETPERAATLRALANLAESRVVLLDGNHGAGQALVSVLALEEIDHVIVEETVPPSFVDALRAGGTTISLCGTTVVTVPPRSSGQATYRIGFANLSETEVFTAEVRRGIEEAAKRAGNIELLLADNNYDGETALGNAEQFIAQRVDLVIEYQTDDSFGYRLMHRLRLARIPTIAIDIPLPGATYFGVDHYHAGRIGGEAIAQEVLRRWTGHLDYIIALGLPRSGQAVAARMQGQIDAILESVPVAPDHILSLDSENVYDTAYHRTLDVLRGLRPGVRVAVVAINDATTRGAVAALVETGHAGNAVAVSQGADRLALEEMQQPGSPVIGAVAYAPEHYGQQVIDLALDILGGKEVPPALYQHHWLVRPDAAAEMLVAHARPDQLAGIPE